MKPELQAISWQRQWQQLASLPYAWLHPEDGDTSECIEGFSFLAGNIGVRGSNKPMPSQSQNLTSALYMVGGSDRLADSGKERALSNTWHFDIGRNEWTAGPALQQARVGFAAAVMKREEVFGVRNAAEGVEGREGRWHGSHSRLGAEDAAVEDHRREGSESESHRESLTREEEGGREGAGEGEGRGDEVAITSPGREGGEVLVVVGGSGTLPASHIKQRLSCAEALPLSHHPPSHCYSIAPPTPPHAHPSAAITHDSSVDLLVSAAASTSHPGTHTPGSSGTHTHMGGSQASNRSLCTAASSWLPLPDLRFERSPGLDFAALLPTTSPYNSTTRNSTNPRDPGSGVVSPRHHNRETPNPRIDPSEESDPRFRGPFLSTPRAQPRRLAVVSQGSAVAEAFDSLSSSWQPFLFPPIPQDTKRMCFVPPPPPLSPSPSLSPFPPGTQLCLLSRWPKPNYLVMALSPNRPAGVQGPSDGRSSTAVGGDRERPGGAFSQPGTHWLADWTVAERQGTDSGFRDSRQWRGSGRDGGASSSGDGSGKGGGCVSDAESDSPLLGSSPQQGHFLQHLPLSLPQQMRQLSLQSGQQVQGLAQQLQQRQRGQRFDGCGPIRWHPREVVCINKPLPPLRMDNQRALSSSSRSLEGGSKTKLSVWSTVWSLEAHVELQA